MLSFAPFITAALAVSCVFALPEPYRRQVDTSCSGIPGAFSTGGLYTLAALNKTETSGEGLPLVLAPPGGHATDDTYRSLATSVTYPNAEYTTFNLSDGELLATKNGVQAAVAEFAYYAGPLDFKISQGATYADTSYCGLVATSAEGGNGENPLLTIYNDAENWWLCTVMSDTYSSPLDIVIYNATDDTLDGLYNFSTCYGVYIQLVAA